MIADNGLLQCDSCRIVISDQPRPDGQPYEQRTPIDYEDKVICSWCKKRKEKEMKANGNGMV